MNLCDHAGWGVHSCTCPPRSRRTWGEQRVPHDAQVLRPDSVGLVEWLEVIDTSNAEDTHRTYVAGRHFARLVIPVPLWLAHAVAYVWHWWPRRARPIFEAE